MREQAFQAWLANRRRDAGARSLGARTISSRLANCRTVERYEGDLDHHFDEDHLKGLLRRLSYSRQDERRNLPPNHAIPIDGNVHNGTATLRSAVSLYKQFRESESVVVPPRADEQSPIQRQYEDYLTGFSIGLNRISNKVSLFTYLKAKIDGDVIPLAPVLFSPILESLLVDSMISIAKLYENSSDRNLNKFLNFVEQNCANLRWQNKPITQERIEAQRRLIASKRRAIENILGQRNKYFAHHDKEYFVDSTTLADDYPVTIHDVEELIRTAQAINNEHSLALRSSVPVTLHEFYVVALDNMFEGLRKHVSHRRNQEIRGPDQP